MLKRRYFIDARSILTRDGLFTAVKASAVPLPEYFSPNLDALYDALTDICEPCALIVRHAGALEANLGPYGKAFAGMLRECERENPLLSVKLRGYKE